MNKRLLALSLLAIGAFAVAGPSYAGNTVLWNPDQGSITFPISPPTNSGATPGRLDNTSVGQTTPAAGAFTTLSASGAVTGAGVTARFAAPGPIGSVTPSTVAATSVTATSLQFSGTAPAPTGTGTPTIATGSTDNAGEVTAGASATSVVITFATAKTNAPFCNVTSQTQLAAFAYSISTTAITVTQTATSGNKIDYNCVQH